jgi:hypothetical protein
MLVVEVVVYLLQVEQQEQEVLAVVELVIVIQEMRYQEQLI